MVPPISNDLKFTIAEQLQHFGLCRLSSTRECSLGYFVEIRAAGLPAFPGFRPGRWSNEDVSGNIIDIGIGLITVIPAVIEGRQDRKL